MTTWRALLRGAQASLSDATCARVLVEEAAGERFSHLTLRLDEHAPVEAEDHLAALVARRKAGEPLQHVVGHWPFRNVELTVDARALIPRPETEVVVEHALNELKRLSSGAGRLRVLDVGTGSGAIACSLVDEREDVEVIAVDNDARALSLARENREHLALSQQERLVFVVAHVLDAFASQHHVFSLVVSNPPYLAKHEWKGLDPVVRDFDPRGALVSGETGLEIVVELINAAPQLLVDDGALVVEIASHQGQAARALARHAGATSACVLPDLAGRDRILIARF